MVKAHTRKPRVIWTTDELHKLAVEVSKSGIVSSNRRLVSLVKQAQIAVLEISRRRFVKTRDHVPSKLEEMIDDLHAEQIRKLNHKETPTVLETEQAPEVEVESIPERPQMHQADVLQMLIGTKAGSGKSHTVAPTQGMGLLENLLLTLQMYQVQQPSGMFANEQLAERTLVSLDRIATSLDKVQETLHLMADILTAPTTTTVTTTAEAPVNKVRLKLPRVMIQGCKPNQLHEIQAEFKNRLHIEGFMDWMPQLAEKALGMDLVIGNVKFMSHSYESHLKKCGEKYKRVNGSVSAIVRELHFFLGDLVPSVTVSA